MGDATSLNKSEISEASDSLESGSDAPLVLKNNETEDVAPPKEPRSHRTGWSAILGGLAAGIIGFLVATYMDTSTWRAAQNEQADLQTTIVARLDELSAEVTALDGKTDTSSLSERIEKLSIDLAAIGAADDGITPEDLATQIEMSQTQTAEDLSVLENRLAEIEDWRALAGAALASTDGLAEDQLSNFRTELEKLTAQAKSEVDAAQSRAAEVEAKAAEMAAQAEQQAVAAERQVALANLTTAIESGDSFAGPLSSFENAPKPLTLQAADGVATLSSLQRDFPNAARDALSMVQTVPQDASATDRFSAFLKRQTNARSLSPKDGDDPDAVLSRAEASLAKGDLGTALSELQLLPDPAKEAMSSWIGKAEAREDALAALSELTNSAN